LQADTAHTIIADAITTELTIQGIEVEDTNQDERYGSREFTEDDVDSFIQTELVAASEGNNADLNSIYTLQTGQEFKSREDAHHYFNFYAYLAGFTVNVTHFVRTTSRKRNNEIVKQEMKCSKHGKPAAKTIESSKN
jgi:hypothetical protein